MCMINTDLFAALNVNNDFVGLLDYLIQITYPITLKAESQRKVKN